MTCRVFILTIAMTSVVTRPAIAQEPDVPATAPATTQQAVEKVLTLAEAKAQEQAETMKALAPLPIIAVKRIDEVVKLSIRNRDLVLDTKVTTQEESQVRVPGLPGLSKVQVRTAGELVAAGAAPEGGVPDPAAVVHFNFENRDYTTPDVIATYTSASFAAGRLTLVQMWETLDERTYNVQLLQNAAPQPEDDLPDPRVTLYVQVTGDSPVDLRLTAENVVELRRKHPAEVARYVDPIFQSLRQEGLLARVDPRLAWQVFGDALVPSDDLKQRVEALVKQLNAESFAEREKASRELENLGQPAALALMRWPRAGLSEEQVGRIDAFVAKFKTVTDADAERMRKDADFLLDCLYAHEEPIRTRALAELRKLTGKDVTFDVTADEEQRLAAITKLREQIGRPSSRQYREPS